MKSKRSNHKEAEEIDDAITQATQYGKQLTMQKKAHRLLEFRCSHIKDEKGILGLLNSKKGTSLGHNYDLYGSQKRGSRDVQHTNPRSTNSCTTTTRRFKKTYLDHTTKKDEYLLSKVNLESDAGNEEKVNTIRNIKKAEHRNQCYLIF